MLAISFLLVLIGVLLLLLSAFGVASRFNLQSLALACFGIAYMLINGMIG